MSSIVPNIVPLGHKRLHTTKTQLNIDESIENENPYTIERLYKNKYLPHASALHWPIQLQWIMVKYYYDPIPPLTFPPSTRYDMLQSDFSEVIPNTVNNLLVLSRDEVPCDLPSLLLWVQLKGKVLVLTGDHDEWLAIENNILYTEHGTYNIDSYPCNNLAMRYKLRQSLLLHSHNINYTTPDRIPKVIDLGQFILLPDFNSISVDDTPYSCSARLVFKNYSIKQFTDGNNVTCYKVDRMFINITSINSVNITDEGLVVTVLVDIMVYDNLLWEVIAQPVMEEFSSRDYSLKESGMNQSGINNVYQLLTYPSRLIEESTHL